LQTIVPAYLTYIAQPMCVFVCFIDPPHFVVRPNTVYQKQLLQTVLMPCLADGDPTPTVTWHRVYF